MWRDTESVESGRQQGSHGGTKESRSDLNLSHRRSRERMCLGRDVLRTIPRELLKSFNVYAHIATLSVEVEQTQRELTAPSVGGEKE